MRNATHTAKKRNHGTPQWSWPEATDRTSRRHGTYRPVVQLPHWYRNESGYARDIHENTQTHTSGRGVYDKIASEQRDGS